MNPSIPSHDHMSMISHGALWSDFPLAAAGSSWSLTTGPAKQDKLVERYIVVAIILATVSKALIQGDLY